MMGVYGSSGHPFTSAPAASAAFTFLMFPSNAPSNKAEAFETEAMLISKEVQQLLA